MIKTKTSQCKMEKRYQEINKHNLNLSTTVTGILNPDKNTCSWNNVLEIKHDREIQKMKLIQRSECVRM